MNREIVKPILIGILLGAALFIMPFFLIRALVFFLIIGALFRLFRGGRRFRRWHHRELHPAFTDTIRDMSEEEYKVYRQKLEANFYGYHAKKGEDNK